MTFNALLMASIIPMGMPSVFAADKQSLLLVNTDKGQVRGMNLSGMHAFRGIPYAKPPVGDLRWMPPVPATQWSGVRAAEKFGEICASQNSLGGFGKTGNSEDCLYLNVYTPEKKPTDTKPYPVMVWIHGGGLVTGSGDDYDVSELVKRDVIVVTFNYRLGVFGYFSHPAINKEPHPAINYGTLDQQAALKWVQTNIGNFGGDSKNVTIFGESAGGHSVLAQLASPGAKGLFSKAIVQSGAYSIVQPTIEAANDYGRKVEILVGCDKLTVDKVAACLRAAPAKFIVEKGPSNLPEDQVVVDGTVIPATFKDAFTSGKFNQVPVINGFNSNEGTFFAGLTELTLGRPLTLEDYKAGLQSSMGKERGTKLFEIAKKTTLKDFPQDIGKNYSAFFGRVKFICPVPIISSMLEKHVPVYTYEFADTTAPRFLAPVSYPYEASHTSELQYLFKNFRGVTGKPAPLTATQQALSEQMVSFWTNFSKKGNPNGVNLPIWTKYNEKQGSTMQLAYPSTMQDGVFQKYSCGELEETLTR
ncbi:carboxylesterase family protein [Pseudomonas aeruginosa]|nr:carboxylesterase family protein [Pseudomonas aeruginosa]